MDETFNYSIPTKARVVSFHRNRLPKPPIESADRGEAELAVATALETPFEAALGAMKELCRRGVHLGKTKSRSQIWDDGIQPDGTRAKLYMGLGQRGAKH